MIHPSISHRPPRMKQDVHDEMTTFLFATFENYVVLSNGLYMMSTHPHVQVGRHVSFPSRFVLYERRNHYSTYPTKTTNTQSTHTPK